MASKSTKSAASGRKKSAGKAASDAASRKRAARAPAAEPVELISLPREVWAGIYAVLGLIAGVAVFKSDGFVLRMLRTAITSLFGWGLYLWPVALLALAALLFYRREKGPVRLRGAAIALVPVLSGALVHALLRANQYDLSMRTLGDLLRDGANLHAGGLLSGGLYILLEWAFSSIGALILVLASLTPSSGGFAFWLGAALLFPFLLWWIYQNSLRRNYRGTQLVHGLTVTYSFWRDHFTLRSEVSQSCIRYDSLYKILETKTAFCLLTGPHQGLAVEKSDCPDGLAELLRSQQALQPAPGRLPRAAIVSNALSLSLLALHLAIQCFCPAQYRVQGWVSLYFSAPVFLLLAVSITLCFAALFTQRLARLQRRMLRLLLQGAALLVGLLCVLCCLLLALFSLDTDREVKNPDGTVTVITPV